MKKIVLSLAIATLLFACGNSSEEKKEEKPADKKEETKTEEPASELSDNPVYQKGLALIAKSDCLTCHKVDEPLTGPTYRDVANKYAPLPDTIIKHLAGKIISGGNGVWGEVFMTPHPAVSMEDAEAMVKYILLLKK
jgi:cytochrome c